MAFMLSVTNKLFKMSVIMLNVVMQRVFMLNVVAPAAGVVFTILLRIILRQFLRQRGLILTRLT
jgi:hypothetical protein